MLEKFFDVVGSENNNLGVVRKNTKNTKNTKLVEDLDKKQKVYTSEELYDLLMMDKLFCGNNKVELLGTYESEDKMYKYDSWLLYLGYKIPGSSVRSKKDSVIAAIEHIILQEGNNF